jgi:hypothetical protein
MRIKREDLQAMITESLRINGELIDTIIAPDKSVSENSGAVGAVIVSSILPKKKPGRKKGTPQTDAAKAKLSGAMKEAWRKRREKAV